MAKIGFYSDLHTEYNGKYQSQLAIDNCQDLYLFAGDLFNLKNAEAFFISLRKQTDKPIIIVLGNHDYYGGQYEQVISDYRKICDKHQIILLEQELYVNNELKLLIFGGTFWTNFTKNGIESQTAMYLSQKYIADFKQIKLSAFNKMAPEFMRDIAEQTLLKLENTFNPENIIKQGWQNYTKIVISHFPPLKMLGNPIYDDELAYFKADYAKQVKLVDIWFYGHDHFNLRFWYTATSGEKTLILSNQHGYINAKGQREIIENQTAVEIDFANKDNESLKKLGNDFYTAMRLVV